LQEATQSVNSLQAKLQDKLQELTTMRRSSIIVAMLAALPTLSGGAAFAGLAGPGPGLTGNDTGGIIPYSPGVAGIYRELAAAHCARWGRLSYVTSVHRIYGDYISFVCIDRPGMIH
jgi:hypothetical protein